MHIWNAHVNFLSFKTGNIYSLCIISWPRKNIYVEIYKPVCRTMKIFTSLRSVTENNYIFLIEKVKIIFHKFWRKWNRTWSNPAWESVRNPRKCIKIMTFFWLSYYSDISEITMIYSYRCVLMHGYAGSGYGGGDHTEGEVSVFITFGKGHWSTGANPFSLHYHQYFRWKR